MGRQASDRFLRQLKTGHLYGWTEILAKRKDMVEFDLESAKVRIEAQKVSAAARMATMRDPAKIAEARSRIEQLTSLSKELTTLETDSEKAMKDQEASLKQSATDAGKPKLNPDDVLPASMHPKMEAEKVSEIGRILEQDAEYQKILVMKDKQELIDYLTVQFGEKPDKRLGMEPLRSQALQKRTERIFEK